MVGLASFGSLRQPLGDSSRFGSSSPPPAGSPPRAGLSACGGLNFGAGPPSPCPWERPLAMQPIDEQDGFAFCSAPLRVQEPTASSLCSQPLSQQGALVPHETATIHQPPNDEGRGQGPPAGGTSPERLSTIREEAATPHHLSSSETPERPPAEEPTIEVIMTPAAAADAAAENLGCGPPAGEGAGACTGAVGTFPGASLSAQGMCAGLSIAAQQLCVARLASSTDRFAQTSPGVLAMGSLNQLSPHALLANEADLAGRQQLAAPTVAPAASPPAQDQTAAPPLVPQATVTRQAASAPAALPSSRLDAHRRLDGRPPRPPSPGRPPRPPSPGRPPHPPSPGRVRPQAKKKRSLVPEGEFESARAAGRLSCKQGSSAAWQSVPMRSHRMPSKPPSQPPSREPPATPCSLSLITTQRSRRPPQESR